MLIETVYATPEQSSYARHARGWSIGLTANLLGYHEHVTRFRHVSELTPDREPADICIFVGDPRRWESAFHPATKQRWIAVMPNSDRILDGVLHAVADAKAHILTPSEWSRQVVSTELIRQRIPGAPIVRVMGLGVSADEWRTADQAWDGKRPIAVLHRTSSATGRKGTRQLIDAWTQAVEEGWVPRDSYLTITVPEAILAGGVRDMYPGGHPNILVLTKADPNEHVGEFHRKFDLCIQPSAAESWGMVPLECLSVGVPVIMSRCGGHSEWSGNLLGERTFPSRGLVPCEECPGARWESIFAEDILGLLKLACSGKALREWQIAQAKIAPRVQQAYSWEAATSAFTRTYILKGA